MKNEKLYETLDTYELCLQLSRESKRGVLTFASPFYRVMCKRLGLDWNKLSDTGKMVLRANGIDTLSYKTDYFHPGSYYKQFYKPEYL